MRKILTLFWFIIVITVVCSSVSHANTASSLRVLKKSYPSCIKSVTNNTIVWSDGEITHIKNDSANPSLLEQINQPPYPTNKIINCKHYIPKTDPGRIRNELFFAKMYGQNESQVKDNLAIIYWLPQHFDHQYPLPITKINNVDKKLKRISDELDILVNKHPEYIKYLESPSGTFYWRNIQNSDRISSHSYGIAIDINSNYADYWIVDTNIKSNNINQVDSFPYKNHVPCEIVDIFEKYGFIWGGKWMHYDTMHFEYRPELVLK